jgi:hypothetical protein
METERCGCGCECECIVTNKYSDEQTGIYDRKEKEWIKSII